MRALLCLALLPTALAAAAFAPAAFADTLVSRADAAELKHDIAGHYRLETGRDVRLTVVDDRLYLDLNRSYRRELHPVADRMLASRDGRLTVQYMPDGAHDQIFIQHPGLPAGVRIGERSWRGR